MVNFLYLHQVKNLKIRYQLLLIYASTFVVIMALSSIIIYSIVKSTVDQHIESELKNSTAAILNSVRTAVSVSIKNHMRATAENNYEIVKRLDAQYHNGEISLEEAQRRAVDIVMCQTIGITGYICILDGSGRVLKHPRKRLEGLDISDHAFVRQMITRKNGYIEYDWQNPDDAAPREKALYMAYYAPWDWLITVSSYRKEFEKLVNISDFKESVLSHRFGSTGYSYVMDMKGNIIIHPELEGVNVFSDEGVSDLFFQKMLKKRNGKLIYYWKTSRDEHFRKKLVIFHDIPEYEWIVASSSYLDEFQMPLIIIRKMIILISVASLILFLPISFILSATITNPLQRLMRHFNQAIGEGFSDRLVLSPPQKDEIGQLANYYNSFMDKLEKYHHSLRTEIRQRKFLEQRIMEIEERERQKIGNDLHDDLCPHLIGIEGLVKVMKQKVISSNQKANPVAGSTDWISEVERRERLAVETTRLAGQIGSLIKEAIAKTRRLARGCCPAYFDHGLESSLRELVANTLSLHDIECTFDCRGKGERFHQIVVINLYHIAGEAVQNAIRHGRANHIEIILEIGDDTLRLFISDDGVGMDPKILKKETSGMGIRIMTYRAKLLGGTLFFHPRKSGGTRVVIDLPRNYDHADA